MNRLKKGLVYISERGGTLRYSDVNRDEKWLQPISEYIPLCKMMRGQPVSIATADDIKEVQEKLGLENDELLSSSETFIVLTNPSKHENTVGLALEYSEGPSVDGEDISIPDPIHICGQGKFNVDPDYLIKAHLEENLSNVSNVTEYIPDFLKNYKENIGKKIFVKGNSDGELTIVEEEAYLAYNNIIQLGFVSNAWLNTTEDNPEKTSAAIEVQVDGDARGPIDTTQFEAYVGETFSIPSTDPTRVFALGSEEDAKFEFKLGYLAGNKKDFGGAFIGVQREDGKTYIINLNTELSTNYTAEDIAFIELGKFFTEGSYESVNLNFEKSLSGSDGNTKEIQVAVRNALKDAVKAVAYKAKSDNINGLSDNPMFKGKTEYDEITTFEVSEEAATTDSFISHFTANEYGGYYNIYVSSEAQTFFQQLNIVSHGSYYNKGFAVLADIRNPARQNIIGVYYSGKYDTIIQKGSKALFIKNGLFKAPVNTYKPGSSYYLASNGKLSILPQQYYNSVVKIGFAQTYTDLITEIDASSRMYFDGDIPVGYMKPSVGGEAEFGFLLMDGKTKHKVEEYQTLFDKIQNWFTLSELQYGTYDFNADKLDDDGNHLNTTDMAEGFILPAVSYSKDNETGAIPAQIKYLTAGVYKELPRTPFIRRTFDTVEKDDLGRAVIPSVDISSLVTYGIEGESVQIPELESLDIRLFADLRDLKAYEDYVWTEIRPGFHLFNNTEYFGFEWRVRKSQENSAEYPYGQYELYTVASPKDIDENALGPMYQETPFSPPESLAGHPLKIFIAKRDYFDRQFDAEALFKNYVKESILDLSGTPWTKSAVSGQAVRDDIKTQVDTDRVLISDKDEKCGTVKAYLEESYTNVPVVDAEKDIKAVVEGDVRFSGPREFSNNYLTLDFYKGLLKYAFENGDLIDNANSSVISAVGEAIKADNWNLIPWQFLKEHEQNLITNFNEDIVLSSDNKAAYESAPHGIVNKGYSGNINASALQGIHLGKPGIELTREATSTTDIAAGAASDIVRVIPYLFKNQTTGQYTETIGSVIEYNYTVVDAQKIPTSSRTVATTSFDQTGNITRTFDTSNNTHTETYSSKSGSGYFDVTYNFADGTYQVSYNGSPLATVTSSREYKKITKEFADSQFLNAKDETWVDYKETISDDETNPGKKVSDGLKNSALQAAYVLPLASFRYNTEDTNLKRWFGVITERVAQAKTIIEADEENKLGGKIIIKNENFGDEIDTGISYNYTQDEKDSIIEYLNFVTNNNDKAMNMLSTVGLLLEAAKETQERLLAVEASTFGKDSQTIPGTHTAPTVPSYATNLPTILGLNRLIKALCAEVFQNADPDKIESGEATLADYSRLDELDKEVNGVGATTSPSSEDSGTHSIKVKNTSVSGVDMNTYPEENEDVKVTSRADAYTVTKSNIFSTGDDFHKENEIFQSKEDTSAYSANKTLGLDGSDFDGINNTVNRIVKKLDALTVEVNGQDNINARPELLDKMRDNIETIIQEVFDVTDYNDDGTLNTKSFKKENLSRIDAIAQRLYNYKLVLQGEKNVSSISSESSTTSDFSADDKKYNLSGKKFNGKQLRGELTERTAGSTEEFTGIVDELRVVTPEAISEHNYATIIDVIIDLISKDESSLVRGNGTITEDKAIKSTDNADTFRYQETILERIKQIESVLDMIAIRFRNNDWFENDAKAHTSAGDAYNDIKSIDEFMNYIAAYSGIGVTASDNTKFLVEPKTDDTTAETYLNKTTGAHLHNAVYDIASRMRAEESNRTQMQNALGSEYQIKTLADDKKIQENGLTDSDAEASYSRTYDITSDLVSLIKLLYGSDTLNETTKSYLTSGIHFNTGAESKDDFGTSDNAFEKLYDELYNLPRRVYKSGTTVENFTDSSLKASKERDDDHSANVLYDMDNTEVGSYELFGETNKQTKLSLGNRNDFVQRTVYGKNADGTQNTTASDTLRVRKNRFEVIEDAIKAIRTLTGMSSLNLTGSVLGNITVATKNTEDDSHNEYGKIDTINGANVSSEITEAKSILSLAVNAYNYAVENDKDLQNYIYSNNKALSAVEGRVATNEADILSIKSELHEVHALLDDTDDEDGVVDSIKEGLDSAYKSLFGDSSVKQVSSKIDNGDGTTTTEIKDVYDSSSSAAASGKGVIGSILQRVSDNEGNIKNLQNSELKLSTDSTTGITTISNENKGSVDVYTKAQSDTNISTLKSGIENHLSVTDKKVETNTNWNGNSILVGKFTTDNTEVTVEKTDNEKVKGSITLDKSIDEASIPDALNIKTWMQAVYNDMLSAIKTYTQINRVYAQVCAYIVAEEIYYDKTHNYVWVKLDTANSGNSYTYFKLSESTSVAGFYKSEEENSEIKLIEDSYQKFVFTDDTEKYSLVVYLPILATDDDMTSSTEDYVKGFRYTHIGDYMTQTNTLVGTGNTIESTEDEGLDSGNDVTAEETTVTSGNNVEAKETTVGTSNKIIAEETTVTEGNKLTAEETNVSTGNDRDSAITL